MFFGDRFTPDFANSRMASRRQRFAAPWLLFFVHISHAAARGDVNEKGSLRGSKSLSAGSNVFRGKIGVKSTLYETS